MLIICPPQFRKRRESSRRATAPLPPPAAVTVLSVSFNDVSVLEWAFSSYVASAGDQCGQMMADDGSGAGMRSPVVIQFDGQNTILAEYDGADFSAGGSWRIPAPLDGVTFVDGTLSVPESGSIAQP